MKSSPILEFFIRHKTAANLLMVMMLVVGFVSADRLNRQFFPDFDVEVVSVSVVWTGATAEDIDANIVQVVEPELRVINNVKKVMSNSYEGVGQISVEFEFGADMKQALADVETAVGQVDLPEESERPKIVRGEFYDGISKLVLSGPYSLEAMRVIAKSIKEDLQRLGVDKVDIKGLPDELIRIEVSEAELARLGMSLDQIAASIRQNSLDVPAGRFADGAFTVRSLGLLKTAEKYQDIEVMIRPDGSRVTLGDIATISEAFEEPFVAVRSQGNMAVEMIFRRGKTNDSLDINTVIQDWLSDYKLRAPESLTIEQYDIRANLIRERINLLVGNGAGGLLLVLGVLFLFLSTRVAFWVAVGIPVAFMATFAVMLAMGQSINMISLFGLIMALGIVVDDAIVIGEHAEYLQKRRGLPIDQAAAVAATRMGPPVVSAMLTTVVAFLPLFTVKGIIGEIISAIPLVVVAVLIASLIEVFFILPAHLAHSGNKAKPGWFRRRFDYGFSIFREKYFRRFVAFSLRWRLATLALAFAMLIVSIGMMASGRVNFVFFTSPEADIAYGNIVMAPGTPRQQTNVMLEELERALKRTEDKLTNGEGGLVNVSVSSLGTTNSSNPDRSGAGGASDIRAGVVVELITADQRSVRMRDFVNEWRQQTIAVPGLDRLTIRAPTGGPPGRDIDIRLMGDDLETLKQAASELTRIVETVPSADAVTENLSYGAEERIIRLTPLGQSLGFSVSSVGQQLRSALDGAIALRFPRGDEEVTVRLTLPDEEVSTDNIGSLRLISPDGQFVQLVDIATVENRLGFSVVRRQDGFREVSITGDLDSDVMSTPEAISLIQANGLPELVEKYGLRYRFDGRNTESKETFADMQVGASIALVGMYIILAWVFSSWLQPLAVMIMIPFALIGAVFGHYFMGLTMTILSMFGLIALAGIVVNNSIILVATIERRIEETDGDRISAIIAGATDRLRPVLLTSITTICGLSTLMFERSLQAQFLIPMATTIVFGLGVTTLLVLFVVPSVLALGEDLRGAFMAVRKMLPGRTSAAE
ncbi:MAG: multidrug transporter [SAR116 cluster bacterium MED-G04]|jgi:multidrug efflux pump subunit AcrB|nr:MAG: multidrug transporter [SAR116 cluster bacterium MED-G04]CAI8446560.1 MAG: Multidrug resistance protein MexB [SAR116 cluster bacterium MED-G04]|tara:strand:- start:232 stop:3366 length:3135 start_codon:yes stop_codon:yes gene_type:complete